MKKVKTRKTIAFVLSFLLIFSMISFVAPAGATPLYGQGKVLLIETTKPWASESNRKMLNELATAGFIGSYDICTVNQFSAGGINLTQYQVIMFANDQTTNTYQRYLFIADELEQYAKSGGVVVFGACDEGWGGSGSLSGALPGGVSKVNSFQHYNYIVDNGHAIVTGALTDRRISLIDSDLSGNYCSHVSFNESTLPKGANIIFRGSGDNRPTLVEYALGSGRVIASGLTWEYYYPGGPGFPGQYPVSYSAYFSAKTFKDLIVYAMSLSKVTVKNNLQVTVVADKTDGSTVKIVDAEVKLYVGAALRQTVKTDAKGIANIDLSQLSYNDRKNATVSATAKVAEGSAINGGARDKLFGNFNTGSNGLPIRYAYELHSETLNYNGQWLGKKLDDISPADSVTLKVKEPRIYYNLAVAYLADDTNSKTDAYAKKVKDTIQYTADWISQATDGHVMLKDILLIRADAFSEFYNANYRASMADIRIETKMGTGEKARIGSNAHFSGFYGDDRFIVSDEYIAKFEDFNSAKTVKGNKSFYRVLMSGVEGAGWNNNLGTKAYATTVTHELGHYMLGFYDEYLREDGKDWDADYGWFNWLFGSQYPQPNKFGLMDNQHSDIEISKRDLDHSYLSGKNNDDAWKTMHYYHYDEAVEDTLANLLELAGSAGFLPNMVSQIKGTATSIMDYKASYKKALDHDRTAEYKTTLRFVDLGSDSGILDILDPPGPPVVAAGAALFAENGEDFDTYFYMSNSGYVMSYVNAEDGFTDVSYETMDEAPENGGYFAISEATRVAAQSLGAVSGEFYAEESLFTRGIDFTDVTWFFYPAYDDEEDVVIKRQTWIPPLMPDTFVEGNVDDGEYNEEPIESVEFVVEETPSLLPAYDAAESDWHALETGYSLNQESKHIGFRCDYQGDGVYVLMAKPASDRPLDIVSNLAGTPGMDRDGEVILSFTDANMPPADYFEILYSQEPIYGADDPDANRFLIFPGEAGECILNLYERDLEAYVCVIARGADGAVSLLSDVILVKGGTADKDRDGLPDWWCDEYFLWDEDGIKDLANTDENGDGLTNLEEYLLEKNPTEFDNAYPPGDVNRDGFVNSTDAQLIMLHLVGTITLTEEELGFADITGDGKVNGADAALILIQESGAADPENVGDAVGVTLASGSAEGLIAGDYIDIPITITVDAETGELRYYACDLGISFDSEALSLDTAHRLGALDMEQINWNDSGKIAMSFASSEPLNGDANLIILTFKILKNSTEPLEISIYRSLLFGFDMQGDSLSVVEISHQAESGSLRTITGGVPVTGISLDTQEASLLVEGTVTLHAEVHPLNAANLNVEWSSSDDQIAIVNHGIVIGKSPGTAWITATTVDGGFTASAKIIVNQSGKPNVSYYEEEDPYQAGGGGASKQAQAPVTTIKDSASPTARLLPFTDVKENDWFFEDVWYVFENSLMMGTSTEPMLFSPNTALTRAMAVSVLYRMAGSPDLTGLTNPFLDVEEGAWYAETVKWAAAEGIVAGYGDGMFGPDDYVSREQLAAILSNYELFAEKAPADVADDIVFADAGLISKWAEGAVSQLTKQGIIGGKPGNLFDPTGNATRAEFAALLKRFFEALNG